MTLAVLDILIGYLREVHIIEMRQEREAQWPEALGTTFRAQSSGSPEINPYLPPSRKMGVALPVLQLLNLLNKFCNELARRVLGISLVVQLRDDFFESPNLKRYPDDFALLGDYTRALTVNCRFPPRAVKDPRCAVHRLVDALGRTAESLRSLQIKFANMSEAGDAFRLMLNCAPALEELGLVRIGTSPMSLSQILENLIGWHSHSTAMPDYIRSLRIIKVRHFEIERMLEGDHGLPSVFSPLHVCSALRSIHLYDPFHQRRPTAPTGCFQDFVHKLLWTRHASEDRFILDSVWLRMNRIDEELPSDLSEFINKTHNLTLQVLRDHATTLTPRFLPDWPPLHSLTLLAGPFPSQELLRGMPTSVQELIIKFEGRRCEDELMHFDDRLVRILERRVVKDVRVYVDTSKLCEINLSNEDMFTKPNRFLFVRTRALCAGRGGRLW